MTSRAETCRLLSERAFELTRSLLPPKEAEVVRAYIYDHNEWGLGIEMLLDVLLEDVISISADQKGAIVEAMSEMGLDRSQSLLRVRG